MPKICTFRALGAFGVSKVRDLYCPFVAMVAESNRAQHTFCNLWCLLCHGRTSSHCTPKYGTIASVYMLNKRQIAGLSPVLLIDAVYSTLCIVICCGSRQQHSIKSVASTRAVEVQQCLSSESWHVKLAIADQMEIWQWESQHKMISTNPESWCCSCFSCYYDNDLPSGLKMGVRNSRAWTNKLQTLMCLCVV